MTDNLVFMNYKYFKMKGLFLLTALVLLGTSVVGLAQNSDNKICFDNLSNQDFKNIMAADKDAVLLDVRTPEEFAEGNIKNSININVLDADFKEKIAKLDKTKTYLIYCRSGARSARAAQIFCDLNFKKVHNLAHGFMGWK